MVEEGCRRLSAMGCELYCSVFRVYGSATLRRRRERTGKRKEVFFDTFFFKGKYAPLAQLVEQLTLNQWVPGSNP